MYKYRISIVTVCLNACNVIEKTILSILNQSYTDFEYVLIDGLSTDNTVEIINRFKDDFSSRNIHYKYYSEKDNGIYDAMNKSLDRINGEWVLFMNAGDFFSGSDVLEKIFREDIEGYDLIYGDIIIAERGYYKYNPALAIENQGFYSPICHQGMITRTDAMREYRFDTTFRLAADYDYLIKIYKDGKRFKKTDIIFSVFELGGTSSKQSVSYLSEMYRSRNINNVSNHKNLILTILKFRSFLVLRFLSSLFLGKIFYSDKRGWYSELKEVLKIKGIVDCE